MIRIFDIKPYAIAAPDALLRCGVSLNTARSLIADTHLDKLLCCTIPWRWSQYGPGPGYQRFQGVT